MYEAILFDAGWVFFAAWSAVLLALSVMAFGRDLVPAEEARPDEKSRR